MSILFMGSGCTDVSPSPTETALLLAKLESHLEARASELGPTHRGLLYPLEQADLRSFMDQIEFRSEDLGWVLGVSYAAEAHGGGLLALLLEHWRPEGRPAELDDAYWFEPNQEHLGLRDLYQAYLGQIFLPIPDLAPGEIRGQLPEEPTLPRMRSRYGKGAPIREADAYRFIGVLLSHEADPGRTWTNHLGQELSASLLLDQVRRKYLAQSSSSQPDHSQLHLVELLLHPASAADANEVKRRFLEVELRHSNFDGESGAEALCHYAESLGRLLNHAGVSWTPSERGQVEDWLLDLATKRAANFDGFELSHLTHLARGLRWVEANREKLDSR